MAKANLLEIYESIDGEGPNAGTPIVIIRFTGCNLSCSYCDTPQARSPTDRLTIFRGSGKVELENPVDVNEIVNLVREEFGLARRILLTGGEPLLQPEATAAMGLMFRLEGLRVQLETNGTLANAMDSCKDAFDLISMDIKLPSTQQGNSLWEEHEEFLTKLDGGKVSAKIVFNQDGLDEVFEALRLVARVNPHIPVFLQPVQSGNLIGVDSNDLIRIAREAQAIVRDVRISIQLHKILGLE